MYVRQRLRRLSQKRTNRFRVRPFNVAKISTDHKRQQLAMYVNRQRCEKSFSVSFFRAATYLDFTVEMLIPVVGEKNLKKLLNVVVYTAAALTDRVECRYNQL